MSFQDIPLHLFHLSNNGLFKWKRIISNKKIPQKFATCDSCEFIQIKVKEILLLNNFCKKFHFNTFFYIYITLTYDGLSNGRELYQINKFPQKFVSCDSCQFTQMKNFLKKKCHFKTFLYIFIVLSYDDQSMKMDLNYIQKKKKCKKVLILLLVILANFCRNFPNYSIVWKHWRLYF